MNLEISLTETPLPQIQLPQIHVAHHPVVHSEIKIGLIDFKFIKKGEIPKRIEQKIHQLLYESNNSE